MDDDIVIRLQWLREEAAEIIKAQADEIERLQIEVAYWKEQVRILRDK